jgi:hypothetical protein
MDSDFEVLSVTLLGVQHPLPHSHSITDHTQHVHSIEAVEVEGEQGPSKKRRRSDEESVYVLEVSYTNCSCSDNTSSKNIDDNNDGISMTHTMTLNRTYHDLHRLHKHMKPTGSRETKIVQFPGTKLKNIMTGIPDSSGVPPKSWRVHGDNWQPQMTKSIRVINKYFEDLIRCCGVCDPSSTDSKNILKTFCIEDLYQKSLHDLRIRKEKESKSRQMQQYFMAPSNIDMIVDLATRGYTTKTENSKACLFVEPSCGDGRVFDAVSLAVPHAAVIGNDLDSDMVAITKAKLCRNQQNTAERAVVHGDFLVTSREMFIQNARLTNAESDLIVVGGPPYTLGEIEEYIG